MVIPFFDTKLQNRLIYADLQAAVDQVVNTGDFILGHAVEMFERDFASYVGCGHCIGVNSGTSALHLALLGCDVGSGDEVITTPLTWISTAWAISYVGARPVFVDIDPATYTLDPHAVERAITPKTRAILPVHLYGQAADISALSRLAETYGLSLIEDAAQAHGAVYNDRRVGSFGKAGCFSFYPSKNLGAFGEAGAVTTDDGALADRIRRLRDHGQQGRNNHVEIGYNARMEGLQGAVLRVKLRYLDAWNAARKRHAQRYKDRLADVLELVLPFTPRPEVHVWHLFVVRLRDRDEVRNRLKQGGVETKVHYPTLVPRQPAYAFLGHTSGDFPIAEQVASHCLSLPLYPELTDNEIDYTIDQLKACCARDWICA